VGAGTVDWGAIFARSKRAGVRHSFVEHDDAPDPFASAAASYSYLRKLRFHDA
jgi:sugar phosphate isomerase/epimerase